MARACFENVILLRAVFVAGDSGIGEESSHFVDENTDGRFYTEDENIYVLLEFSHKYVPDTQPKYHIFLDEYLLYLVITTCCKIQVGLESKSFLVGSVLRFCWPNPSTNISRDKKVQK